jgi:serine-type anaerobic sulfatase-maturating enzyme
MPYVDAEGRPSATSHIGHPVHVQAKPSGAICNLAGRYCFYLEKEALYPGSQFRMPDAVVDAYIRQVIDGANGKEVFISWQGGEPTLMGIPFFQRMVAVADELRPPALTVRHSIQTNGTLLDEDWASFLRRQKFLVGISLDGPADIHDAYRVNRGGRGTYAEVLRGVRLLQQHRVDYNVLTTVNAVNQDRPLDVYRHLRDEVGAQFIQFIPIVGRLPGSAKASPRSVSAMSWGRFLIAVFDEWVGNDVGSVFVNMFDVALGNWIGAPPSLCVHAPTCGDQLALEHNGDVYACDHFVDSAHRLGNLLVTDLAGLIAKPAQRQFGLAKRDALPKQCRTCGVRFACHGGCPKDRFTFTEDGEEGLNHLCAGYFAFFKHVDGPMQLMGYLLRQGRPAAEAMAILRAGRRLDADLSPRGDGS